MLSRHIWKGLERRRKYFTLGWTLSQRSATLTGAFLTPKCSRRTWRVSCTRRQILRGVSGVWLLEASGTTYSLLLSSLLRSARAAAHPWNLIVRGGLVHRLGIQYTGNNTCFRSGLNH